MQTLLKYIRSLSVYEIASILYIDTDKAEHFSNDTLHYGLAAFESLTAQKQCLICKTYYDKYKDGL